MVFCSCFPPSSLPVRFICTQFHPDRECCTVREAALGPLESRLEFLGTALQGIMFSSKQKDGKGASFGVSLNDSQMPVCSPAEWDHSNVAL